TANQTSPAERKALGFQADAFRSAEEAARRDDKNVEAQAALLFKHFNDNNLRGAYPYARGLIENLANAKNVELEDFNDYVIGAYYILALKEMENHPDQALAYLEASLAREKPRPPATKAVPRWRAVDVESRALLKKVEMAAAAKLPKDQK